MSQKTAEHPPAESLLDFIRGALERAATERIGRHLATCRECREFVERSSDSVGTPSEAAAEASVPAPAPKPAEPPVPVAVAVTAPTPKPTAAPPPKPAPIHATPPPKTPPPPEPVKAEAAPPPPAPKPAPAAPPAAKAEAAPKPVPAAPPAAKAEAAPKPPSGRTSDTPHDAQTMGPIPRIEVDGDEIPPELRQHPRYELRHKLGAGGMGVVFLAQHKVMERLVALKVLHQSLLATPETVERFRREARAAARLDHPNIVKAFDAETVGDWQILVMEFVEGRDMADATQHRGPFSVLHACNYAFQVAMGLQHAHEMDMVHRDLKPQNLMLTSKGVVKILDFGLAKLTAASPHQPGLTTKDVVIGTPEFIAPEQARDTASADIRSDIYSLGCTLYYFLTGEPPFVGDSPVATVIKHLNDEPPRLEAARPDAPPELCQLYWRMVSKDPARRPQTPLEVAEALRPFAVKPGTPSGYDTGALPPPEPVRTPYLKYALMFAALLAAGAGAGVLLPRIIPGTPPTTPKTTLAAGAGPATTKPGDTQPSGKSQTPDAKGDAVTKPPATVNTKTGPEAKDNAAAEAARIEQEKEDAAAAKAEAQRIAKEKSDAATKVEAARIAKEKQDATAKAEAARIEQEKKDAAAKAEAEREKDATMKAEAARLAREKKEAEAKAEAERLERERKEAEERKKEEERLTAAKMAREKEEAERKAKEPKALEALHELKGHRAAVTSAAFAQADRLLTAEDRPPPDADKRSPIIMWDMVAGQRDDEPYTWHWDRTRLLAVAPESKPAAPDAKPAAPEPKLVASFGGVKPEELDVWDRGRRRNVFHLYEFPKSFVHLAFSNDGRLLGAVNLEERVTVWSMTNGQFVRRLQASNPNRAANPATAVTLRADRGLTLAASGYKDGTLRLWDARSGDDLGSIMKLHAVAVTAVAFAPDNKRVATVAADGSLRVTDTDSSKTVAQAEAGGALKCVAWTANSERLVTGGEDGVVRVWEAATGKELFRGAGHQGPVTCVAAALPDGKTQLFASGGDDKTVRVWSAKAE